MVSLVTCYERLLKLSSSFWDEVVPVFVRILEEERREKPRTRTLVPMWFTKRIMVLINCISNNCKLGKTLQFTITRLSQLKTAYGMYKMSCCTGFAMYIWGHSWPVIDHLFLKCGICECCCVDNTGKDGKHFVNCHTHFVMHSWIHHTHILSRQHYWFACYKFGILQMAIVFNLYFKYSQSGIPESDHAVCLGLDLTSHSSLTSKPEKEHLQWYCTGLVCKTFMYAL